MKKKFKYRVAGRKPKSSGVGATLDGDSERVDSTSSLPQPGPHIVVGEDYDREGDRADVAGGQVSSAGRPPQPDGPGSVPARVINTGQEADVDGGEASQRRLRPDLDVGVAVGSGRSGEPGGVYPSPSTPSISRGGEPDST